MDVSDATLVEECLNGETEAFGVLVERHQEAVYNLALRMSRSAAEAADATQETFLRGYRKLDTYVPHYAFRNWILTICANVTKNRFRAAARRRQAEESHAEMESLRGDEGERPDGVHDVDEALRQMPEEVRLPLVLKHVEGCSYLEIADMLRIGVSAAKMRVKRARDELVRRLEAAGRRQA